jgi:predicted GNAT family acetyltransferase
MVCAGPIEERADGYEPVVLGDADVPAMLALTELTHPGPFGPLTHRLGTYIGIKIEGRLVAMAGERFVLPGYREISAVCTHPDWQGRGFARRLMARLAAAIYDSGLTPFLHVLAANHPAIALYERLGFRHRRTFTLQVLRRAAAPGPP